MKKILIDKNKCFYKANLHSHTTYSDGKLTPFELKEEYAKRGYSVVAITDHEHLIDNSRLNDENFLTITSCELNIKENADFLTGEHPEMKAVHLNILAFDPQNTQTPCYSSKYDRFINEEIRGLIKFNGEYERNISVDGINEIIRIANENGFLVVYNHPSWSLDDSADRYLKYEGLFGVEIVNGSVILSGGYEDEHILDDFWRAGKPVYCIAADDCHAKYPIGSKNNDCFRGWVQINAETLTYDNIMNALKNGEFYASAGPEIYSLVIDGNKVKIEFSDCVKVNYITKGRRSLSVIADEGETVNYAEFEIKEKDVYFRITVVDKNGKKAYTQVYEISDK